MINSERSAVTIRKTLHKGVWVDDLSIEERHAYANPVNVVKASGIIYTGGSIEDVCPSFSEAPGNAPKVYGKEKPYDRLILDSQANLNIRTGRALAKHTARYPNINATFINDGSFTVAPQELFTSNVEASDNGRGQTFTTRLLPRRISRIFDNQGGYIGYDVGFEPETDGPPGITVDLPCGPPAQVWPATLPVDPVERGCVINTFSSPDEVDDGATLPAPDVFEWSLNGDWTYSAIVGNPAGSIFCGLDEFGVQTAITGAGLGGVSTVITSGMTIELDYRYFNTAGDPEGSQVVLVNLTTDITIVSEYIPFVVAADSGWRHFSIEIPDEFVGETIASLSLDVQPVLLPGTQTIYIDNVGLGVC